MTLHVMVDVETMGQTPRAPVASLGAVAFDPWGDEPLRRLGYVFYRAISLKAQRNRDWDGDTVSWWMRQSDAARTALLMNPEEPGDVLWDFRDFLYASTGEDSRVVTWSYGANFDHPILVSLWSDYAGNDRYPVHFRNQLCARTLIHASNITLSDSGGESHNALDDAVRQAEWLRLAVAALRIPRF